MKWKWAVAILIFILAFYFQLLGMMKLAPLIVTTPILFIVIFAIMVIINNRKRFRGFGG